MQHCFGYSNNVICACIVCCSYVVIYIDFKRCMWFWLVLSLDFVCSGKKLETFLDSEGGGLLNCYSRFVLYLAQFLLPRRNMGGILPIPFVEHVEL